jgi:D-alanyl-D-alanine carboxypeptidase
MSRSLKTAIRRALLPLCAAVLLIAAAPPEIPDTPAGKAFAAWLTSFNSGDPAQLKAFDAAYPRENTPPIEGRLQFRANTGGFNLVRIEKSEPTELIALVQEKESDTVARMTLKMSADEKPRLLSASLGAIDRPADLAIPRMSEAEALAALSARADELAKKDEFSGAVLVARNNKILLQKAWGLADREKGTPNTTETRFRMGSMNKMFTSVSILQLVEAGKLSLDDTVGKILTDYPNQDIATKVKIRNLLTHTGGTGDIFGPDFEKNRLTLREHADYVKLYGARGLTHEPGAEFRYSNYGFVLLGRIIEKVTGQSYYDYVRAHIFKPAGMTATDSLSEEDKVPNRSVGYFKPEGKWVPNTDTLPWRGTSAGGGYTTVGDLFKFAQALESGKLISKKMLAQATTPFKEDYGFGFGMQGEGRMLSYGHGGGAPGMNGELRIYPQLGYVLVSLANLDPPAATRMVNYYALRMPV